MRKPYLFFCAIVFTVTASSHTFITEILVNNNPGQYSNQYNTVQTYSFTEDEIMQSYDENVHSVKDIIRLETLKEVIPTTQTIQIQTCENVRVRGSDSGSELKTCGQFDHFNAARAAAIKTCYTLNTNNPGQYPSGLIPRFSGPATFVNFDTATVNHHDVYHVSHGLQFSCVEVLLYTE